MNKSERKPVLVEFVGVPGSGKSSLARIVIAEMYCAEGLDAFRIAEEAQGEYP